VRHLGLDVHGAEARDGHADDLFVLGGKAQDEQLQHVLVVLLPSVTADNDAQQLHGLKPERHNGERRDQSR
jgi:hypothetical protein